jgi:hypothetical protein
MKGFIVDLVGVPSNNRRVIFCRLPLAPPLWTFLATADAAVAPRRPPLTQFNEIGPAELLRPSHRGANAQLGERFLAALFNQLGSGFAGHACSMGNLLSSAVRRPHHGQKEGDVSLKS